MASKQENVAFHDDIGLFQTVEHQGSRSASGESSIFTKRKLVLNFWFEGRMNHPEIVPTIYRDGNVTTLCDDFRKLQLNMQYAI